MTATATLCESCGARATYHLAPLGLALCDDCARAQGAHALGELYAALRTLGFVVAQLRTGGLTDRQIHEALHATLTEPHSEGSYPVGGDAVLDYRSTPPWTIGLSRLEN